MSRHVSIVFILLPALLCGCVNLMSMQGPEDKIVRAGDIDAITPGMTEKQVVSRLGNPVSFGVDEDGREYLHYETWKFSRTEKAAMIPFIGVISTSANFSGFISNIYINDGLVQGKSFYVYRKAGDRTTPADDQPHSNQPEP